MITRRLLGSFGPAVHMAKAVRTALLLGAPLLAAPLLLSAPPLRAQSPRIADTRADSIERVRVRLATADTAGPGIDALLAALTAPTAPSDDVTLWQIWASRLLTRPTAETATRAVLRDCLRRFPGNRPCAQMLATRLRWDQAWPAAHDLAAELVRQDPQDAPARLVLAHSLWGMGDRAAARREFLTLQRLTPTDPEPAMALAQIAQQTGNLADAQRWATEAARLVPGWQLPPRPAVAPAVTSAVAPVTPVVSPPPVSEPPSLAAVEQLRVSPRADSIEQVRVWFATAPSPSAVSPQALVWLRGLTGPSAPSDDVQLWQRLADRLTATEDGRAEARTVYSDCVRRFPTDRPCRLGLATVATWATDVGTAEPIYQALLTDNPNDIEARLGLARLIWWRGQPREARRHFLAIQGLAPRRPEAYVALAQIAAELGEREEAASWREAMRRVAPQDVAVQELTQSARWDGGHQLWLVGGGTLVPGLGTPATEWRVDWLQRVGQHRLSVGLGRSRFGPSGMALPPGVIAPQGALWIPTLGWGPDGPRRHGLALLGYGLVGDSVRATGVWLEPWIGLGGEGAKPRVRLLGTLRPEYTMWPTTQLAFIAGGGLSVRLGRHEVGTQTWHLDQRSRDAAWLQQLTWDAAWNRRLETRVTGQAGFGRQRDAQTLGVRVRTWPASWLGLQGEWWYRQGFATRETFLLGLGLRW